MWPKISVQARNVPVLLLNMILGTNGQINVVIHVEQILDGHIVQTLTKIDIT